MADLKASLADAVPAATLTPPLRALWWAAKGDWGQAHRIVQDEIGADAAWVHAYRTVSKATSATPPTGTARPVGP